MRDGGGFEPVRDAELAQDVRDGTSEAPLEPEHYADGQLWADDVAAVIEQLRLDRPVLVGWSYGGFITCEHVLATCPTAEPSWYEGVGHTPHLEAPERFNRELAALTRRVRA